MSVVQFTIWIAFITHLYITKKTVINISNEIERDTPLNVVSEVSFMISKIVFVSCFSLEEEKKQCFLLKLVSVLFRQQNGVKDLHNFYWWNEMNIREEKRLYITFR